MEQRWLRAPCALAMSGAITYTIDRTIMSTVYLNDLKEMKMDKYFELDLDADMMKQDLS